MNNERPARVRRRDTLHTTTYTRIHSFLVFSSDSRSRLISRPRCPNRDRTREREPMNHDRDASSRVAMRVAFFASRNSAGPEKRPDARTHARARRATQLWSHTDTPHTHTAERVLPPAPMGCRRPGGPHLWRATSCARLLFGGEEDTCADRAQRPLFIHSVASLHQQSPTFATKFTGIQLPFIHGICPRRGP